MLLLIVFIMAMGMVLFGVSAMDVANVGRRGAERDGRYHETVFPSSAWVTTSRSGVNTSIFCCSPSCLIVTPHLFRPNFHLSRAC